MDPQTILTIHRQLQDRRMKSGALKSRLAHSCRSLSQFLQHEAVVHRMCFPRNSPVPIYTAGSVERGTVRVKCLAEEHNTVSPTRARTQTARSGDERTNHEASGMLLFFFFDNKLSNYTLFYTADPKMRLHSAATVVQVVLTLQFTQTVNLSALAR